MKPNKELKIFLVDKDQNYLNATKKTISQKGYNFINTFLDGDDCLKALNQKPDIIFLDHNLSDSRTSKIIRLIKLFNHKILVVIVIDPKEIKTDINTSNFGIFDYVIKGSSEPEKTNSILLKASKIDNTVFKRFKRLFSVV